MGMTLKFKVGANQEEGERGAKEWHLVRTTLVWHKVLHNQQNKTTPVQGKTTAFKLEKI